MDRRDVVITGFRLNASEQPAKVLQRVLGLEEGQARALSKRFPSVVRADEAWAEAERLMLALRDAGAYAHLREPSALAEPMRMADTPKTTPPADLAPAVQPHALPQPPPAMAAVAMPQPVAVAAPPLAPPVAAPMAPPMAPPAAAVATAPVAAPVAAVATAPVSALAPLPKEEWGTAPTLFSTKAEEGARVSHYTLGELEVVAPKSQPAPAMATSKSEAAPAFKSQPAHALKSQPAPALKSQPAPAIKSQPAPALKSQPAPALKSQPAPALKSQPAPAIKSQPAPAPDVGLEAAGLRMLGDSFDDDGDDGRSFELDERALGHQTNRVQVEPRGNANTTAPARKRRGLFATLLLPLVLAQAAIPHALALTGVAAASGAAVYIARTSGRSEANTEAAGEIKGEDGELTSSAAPNKRRVRAKKEGIMGMLESLTGGDKESADDARLANGQDKDKQLDDPGLSSDGPEKATRKEATHPMVRMAPKAMEGSIASILRSRIRGVHKVSIKWQEGTRPEGSVECMLLEQAEAASLKELASTGSAVEMPLDVRDQLQDHILVLRTANADPEAAYLPICLAN